MTQTDSNTVTIKELLAKYELQSPLSSEFQSYISSEMGSIFKRVLKRSGQYSFFSGIFISLYFFLKKHGIHLTVTRIALSIVTALPSAVGGYFLYINMAEEPKITVPPIKERAIKGHKKSNIILHRFIPPPYTSAHTRLALFYWSAF